MFQRKVINFIILYISFELVLADTYIVSITSDDPVVLGAEVHFKAEIFDEKHNHPQGSFRYTWRDNAIPEHRSAPISPEKPYSEWSARYPASSYPPGPYTVEVEVEKWFLMVWLPVTSQRRTFQVTARLNGHMALEQNRTARDDEYVSSANPLSHSIVLNAADAHLLRDNATYVLTYWFVDCVYYGQSDNFSFEYMYKGIGSEHYVEALVVASYDQLPPVITTTTPAPTTTTIPTTTTTSTTTITTTTPATTITTIPSSTTDKNKHSHLVKRGAIRKNATQIDNRTTGTATTNIGSVDGANLTDTLEAKIFKTENEENAKNLTHTIEIRNETDVVTLRNDTSVTIKPRDKYLDIQQPFVCLNKSIIAPVLNKTYGYFYRKVIVQAPVGNLSVTGNNWLQHGDVLNLKVNCQGTPPFRYCVILEKGQYNITGNETCISEIKTDLCEFPIVHYFPSPKAYTIVVIIKNNVAKLISPVAVTIYKVNKAAQLSVIVVPVTASLVAITLIIFGIAYYIQNRSRFTVEVADFDFGRAADMEYRTFWERVEYSVRDAIGSFRGVPRSDQLGPQSTDSALKYGSMT